MGSWDCKKEVVPFTAMFAVEFATVGVNTLYKAATSKGLSFFVYVGYSYVIGTLVLLPLPFIFPRRELPPFKISVFFRIGLVALFGLSNNLCRYKGIEYSSPTLASAMNNLTPTFTFILAVIFRMENIDMRSKTTRSKIVGTILSISGALVAVLYKGPTVLSFASSSPSLPSSLSLQYPLRTSKTNWALGGLLLVFENLLNAFWYIFQTQAMKTYPDAQIVSLIYFLLKTSIALPICFLAETKLSAWTLRPDIVLATVVLSGVFGPSFNTLIHTWGVHLKGPLYIAIFKPFSIAIAAAFGVIFLGDALFLGSVVGATILLLGFYAVIWGKAQEDDAKDCLSDNMRASPDGKTPLLQS